jgi:hypothetical protein
MGKMIVFDSEVGFQFSKPFAIFVFYTSRVSIFNKELTLYTVNNY